MMSSTCVDTDGEAQISTSIRKPGGWITSAFILASMGGLSLAAGGWILNLMVYLIEEFNVKSIDAAQIYNVFNGCTALFPVLGAIIADSFLGCYSVIWISSLISLLGLVLLMVTSSFNSLRPPQCETGSMLCKAPSKIQLSVLYAGLAMATIGVGGTKFTLGTMGANQFDNSKNQETFFDCFIFSLYGATVISVTAIVYVQDSVSWSLGFGITVLANLLGLAIFLLGSRFYRHVKAANGSPFSGLARVVVATVRKREVVLPVEAQYYCQEQCGIIDGVEKVVPKMPSNILKFLNHAAVTTEGDTKTNGSIAKPWKLCTVQQVEDLKGLIKILPLWSTGIFLATPLAIQGSLTVLQALTMDRHIGHDFQIPASTMTVFIFLTTSAALPLIKKFVYPAWQTLIGQPLTPLQRIGIGHVLDVLSMAVSALVESKRLKETKSHNLQNQSGVVVPISVFWLVPQLAIVGVAEAFHFPGQIALYYQEFPKSLKSTATAMVSLFIAIAFYLSTAIVDTARRMTHWLPDNINHGRIDNVYWVIVVIGVLNFCYFLVCAYFYKYQSVEEVDDTSNLLNIPDK